MNLESFSVAEQFALTDIGSWANDPFRPEQVMTIPGRPLDYIVSQDHLRSTYASVRVYFDGVMQSTGNSHDPWSMARGATPGVFYGFNHSDTGFDFTKSQINDGGFETLVSKRDVLSGFSTRIAGEDDLIFTNTGVVADGVEMVSIAKINLPWGSSASGVVLATDVPKCPQPAVSRVFQVK